MKIRWNSGQFRFISVAALSLAGTLNGSIVQPRLHDDRTLQVIPRYETRLFHPDETVAANKSLAISVEFEMHPGDEGVLVMGGTEQRTFSLDVKNGRVFWIYKYALQEPVMTMSSESLPTGLVSLRCELDSKLGNRKLSINGKVVPVILGKEGESLHSQFTGAIRRIDFEEKAVQ